MTDFTSDQIRQAMVSPRWAGQVRTGLDPFQIATWDTGLLRHPRVLVPMDVQALYVAPGDPERYVVLPFALTTPDGAPVALMPAPFDPPVPRPPGVHLHWAVPAALLRGSLTDVASGSTNRLALPALPDRWVVVRVLVPAGASAPVVTGWVLEADTAKAIPLDQYPAASASATSAGKTVAAPELTGTVGGTTAWAGVYDAVTNRFAFHDPLDDLATIAPEGVRDQLGAYVVAGWWSHADLDPLDVAHTSSSLSTRLDELGWWVRDDGTGTHSKGIAASFDAARRSTIGLDTASRYSAAAAAVSLSSSTQAAGPLASGGGVDAVLRAVTPIVDYRPASAAFVDDAAAVYQTEPQWPRASLLHGVVFGVPVAGPVVVDQRPTADAVELFLGHSDDDIAATIASNALAPAGTVDERRSLERLVSAFTGQTLAMLGTVDGLADVDEHEHDAAFASRDGGQGAVERLQVGATAGPLSIGRKARSAQVGLAATLAFTNKRGAPLGSLHDGSSDTQQTVVNDWHRPDSPTPATESREVRRPLPRFHAPINPLIAVRGAMRSRRFEHSLPTSSDGRLWCLWPADVLVSYDGVIAGGSLVPRLPSGAVPDEVLSLVQNAVVANPYLAPWLAEVAAKAMQVPIAGVRNRLFAEVAARYGGDAVYDGNAKFLTGSSPTMAAIGIGPIGVNTSRRLADETLRFSLANGADLDPKAVTAWSQPWVPLWLEWEVELSLSERFEGWTLDTVDLVPPPDVLIPPTRVLIGRSALHNGTVTTLREAITEWLTAEGQRDRDGIGEIDEATADLLSDIAGTIDAIDVATTSIDSLDDQLLGLPVEAFGVLHARVGDTIVPPAPIGPPQLVSAGRIRVNRARVVDGFGRFLDLPNPTTHVPVRDEIATAAGALTMHPRLTVPARTMFRLVDPLDDTREASVDQIDPSTMVNPVLGFLLPDHIDEALEVFDTAGNPLGQLSHEPIGGGVTWEIAPGRIGPADAGPGFGLDKTAQERLGFLASGVVQADAKERGGKAAVPDAESSLSALLRAIDTTLWTVDTFAVFGTEHIVGLVGRPIAVVRATLRLELDDDLDALDLSDPTRKAEREAAYGALADRSFPVRIGELTRSDDGLLAFFVDDDYSRLRVVDKAVLDGALDSGRQRGHFGRYGETPKIPRRGDEPDGRPIVHPYLLADDELAMHLGQTVRLTLLMHPSSKVHLTSGVLPRKDISLVRDWVQPGLAVMAPSVRVGPVLLEPGQVRLPKVGVFPKEQLWTRRDTPSTWKDDPILAATQTALLPELPSQIEEGWIRVAPVLPAPTGSA